MNKIVEEGFEARISVLEGKPWPKNPYEKETENYKLWEHGYKEASAALETMWI